MCEIKTFVSGADEREPLNVTVNIHQDQTLASARDMVAANFLQVLGDLQVWLFGAF